MIVDLEVFGSSEASPTCLDVDEALVEHLLLQLGQVGDNHHDEQVDHGDRAQDDHRQQEEHGKTSTYPIPEREIS